MFAELQDRTSNTSEHLNLAQNRTSNLPNITKTRTVREHRTVRSKTTMYLQIMIKTCTFRGFELTTTTGTLIYDWSFTSNWRAKIRSGQFKNCPFNSIQTIFEEISISANTKIFNNYLYIHTYHTHTYCTHRLARYVDCCTLPKM